jgi:glucose-6-phosphate 1-dehydrogenase
MLHIIACLAMEWPDKQGDEARRDARGRLLQCIAPLRKDEIVRGQYQGYHDEKDVAPDSRVETYFAGCFHIENPRWQGVPFYVRVGKRLPVTCTEVMVRIKPTTRFGESGGGAGFANYYRFRISPEMVIALGTQIKKPGEEMEGEAVELIAHEQEPDAMQPYQRLLGDVIVGDPTLFAREDAVDAAWRAVAPALDEQLPLYEYAQGSWGPQEAEKLLEPSGGWHNPS